MYWRRRLPHWTPEDSAIFVTWRLAGTLPSPDPATWPQWLLNPQIANIFAEALIHGETVRRSYDLLARAVMSNHVHVVMEPLIPVSEIMRWLKVATANRANKLLGNTGKPFWRREYYDRWIRTTKELSSVIAYVEDNPVRGGLAASPRSGAGRVHSKNRRQDRRRYQGAAPPATASSPELK